MRVTLGGIGVTFEPLPSLGTPGRLCDGWGPMNVWVLELS